MGGPGMWTSPAGGTSPLSARGAPLGQALDRRQGARRGRAAPALLLVSLASLLFWESTRAAGSDRAPRAKAAGQPGHRRRV